MKWNLFLSVIESLNFDYLICSPANTRPPSPKSDTEVDRQRQGEVDQSILSEEDSTMWEWGDLPRRSEHKVLPIESGNKEAGAKNGAYVHYLVLCPMLVFIFIVHCTNCIYLCICIYIQINRKDFCDFKNIHNEFLYTQTFIHRLVRFVSGFVVLHWAYYSTLH